MSLYEIVCFVGVNTVVTITINTNGEIVNDRKKPLKDKQRIVSISNDRWLKKGTLILTDSSKSEEIYIPKYATIDRNCKIL